MAIVIPTMRSFTYLDDGNPTPVVTTSTACIICTLCPFIFTASNSGRQAASLYVAYQFQVTGLCVPSNRTLSIFYDAVGTIGNQFQIFADGVSKFDSGCVNTSGSGSAVIPAGTQQFDALVYGACNGSGNDLWSFSAGCNP